MNAFTRAIRKKVKMRMAICGPSGSGKTYSALVIAQGLSQGGEIAVIDTESGSASLYSHLTGYDVAELAPPYTPARYRELIKSAEIAGYTTIIIDGLSHAWSGEGGILAMHDNATAASRTQNSYMAWRDVTPQHNMLIDTMLTSSCHIIATMRTKTAYDIVDEGNGRKKPVKLGMAPVQRDGMEYEFTLVFDLSVDKHIATSSKDRTGLFDGQFFLPSITTGETIAKWLDSGVDTSKKNGQTPTEDCSYGMDKFLLNFPAWKELVHSKKKTPEQIIANIEKKSLLTEQQKVAILALYEEDI